jgi:energy-coupling factor transporter ATP-binding protein EcfA2
MWISRFQVENFSSFSSSGWIDLDQRFNLFIGQNNSGKTALLRALSHPLPQNAHKNATHFRGADLKTPRVSIDVQLTVKEMFDRMRAINQRPALPSGDGNTRASAAVAQMLNDPAHRITVELERSPGAEAVSRGGASISEFRNPERQMTLYYKSTGSGWQAESNAGRADNLSLLISDKSNSVFHFDAQRLNIGRSTWDSADRLKPDASNLPAVLARLQGSRRPIFDLVEVHLTSILGGIERITVTPRGTDFEILVWPDRNARHEELAFSLNDSGTGVGQLLAIITAVVTSEQSIIVIDEVNSFLHPAAVKRLLALLRSDYPEHQYIISTHSADAIASCGAERIYIVSRSGFESHLQPVKLEDAEQAREVASALGFSMMDVFGFERMIWVEGPTEEICFPYLAKKRGLLVDPSIGFASGASTSSFESRRGESRSAAEIYETAGRRLSPLLKGMAFALDRERLSDAEVAQQEKSKRKLRFLPRRCLECFFLLPSAIAEVLTSLDVESHTEEEVAGWISTHGGESKYGASAQWDADLSSSAWLAKVDAARLLADLFRSLSDARVEYRKTRDGISLQTLIEERHPENLNDLVKYLQRVVEVALRDTPP